MSEPKPEASDTLRIKIEDPDSTITHYLKDPLRDEHDAVFQNLIENYHSIRENKVIYYPVPYRLAKVLGRGRQGTVFLGFRQGGRGCVTRHAIKIFDPGIYPDTEAYWTDMSRLADQISRLQPVSSPNLVSRDIFDESNGVGYAQMELIQGVDLKYLLSKAHLEKARAVSSDGEWQGFMNSIFRVEDGRVGFRPGVAIYILRGILRGLETLHSLGFVHYDIKPANVMINRHGHVKVIDFGRAVRINEKVNYLMGTPAYLAPETHRGETGDARSDLFSLGLMAIELLRGDLPLKSLPLSEAELLAEKLKIRDQLAELLPDEVHKNEILRKVLQLLLAPEREQRFANAKDAGSGKQGMKLVHKQLTLADKDFEYDRALSSYIVKIASPIGTDGLPTVKEQD